VATNLAFNPVTGRMSEYTFEELWKSW
jgi:hypothetical protein